MPFHHNTRQKTVIADVLKNTARPMTAEDIIYILHQSGTNVGRATVYRYLRELESIGRVHKYTLGDKNISYYQYTDENSHCKEHYHLMCDVCGSVEHLDALTTESFAKNALESFGFEIDCSKTVFYGKCKKCSER